MALPLIARGRVIGAMTVQSEEPSAFSDENITTLQTMADQVAISIENARLFGEQQQASLLLQERIKELNCLNDIGRKVDEAPPVYAFLEWVVQRIPPATRYPDVCTAAIEFEGRVYGAPEAMGLPCQMVQSLRVGGEVVGRVYMAYQEERPFTDGDSALLGGIARRISGYIENRRLFDQTQTALAEVEAVHHSYLQRRWEDYLYHQDLLRDNGFLYDQAIAEGIADARHDAERAAITLEPNLWRPEISRAIAEGQIVTAEGNGSGEERTALAVPIVLRGQTIGVLGIEDPDGRRRWTEEEAALVEAVSRQLALALENARLLEETQRRAARERVNREITDRLRRASDMDHLLQTVVREMSMALGASSAFVQLTAPATRDQNGQDEAGARPQVE
jgi:GAF domain-containing protein